MVCRIISYAFIRRFIIKVHRESVVTCIPKISTKYNLRETTRSNYIYMYNRFVRDDNIRKNPTDGVMAEIKKNSGKMLISNIGTSM